MTRSTQTAAAELPNANDADGYPNTDWTTQRSKYATYWDHFDGDSMLGIIAE